MKQPQNLDVTSKTMAIGTFLQAITDRKYTGEALIALGFDGQGVHMVTGSLGNNTERPIIFKPFQWLEGFAYMGGVSFNGADCGFIYDAKIDILPNANTFFAGVVQFVAERMRALGVKTLEEATKLPENHGTLAMKVAAWAKGELANMRSLMIDGKPIEHLVLLSMDVGAVVSAGKKIYYIPVDVKHHLENDTKRWTLIGETEKAPKYLSREVNKVIVATLKGEKSHQKIAVDRLTPDNPRAATIGPETKGDGIVIGMVVGKTNTLAMLTKDGKGNRDLMVMGADAANAPRIVRESWASAAA